MDKAQYITLQQKIKAGTATPEEIQAVKEYESNLDNRNWFEKGSTVAEDTISKYNGQTSADIANQRITPGQAGVIPKGNQGDNAIANPNALNTSEVSDVHQKELASVQSPENMEPGTFSPDSKIREEAEQNKAVQSVTQPQKGDSPREVKAKNKYNKATMSIWDAYYAGEFGEPGSPEAKRTAGYFTIDAIATLASNLGRRIGNVGAQFSGGTIDNGHDESKWSQRNETMLGNEVQAESEEIKTFDNKFKQLSYNRQSTLNDLLEAVKGDAEKLSDDNPLKIAYLSLAASIANGDVSGETTLAATGAKGITELFDLFKSKGKDKK